MTPTALLDPADLADARRLMDLAFGDFSDDDWEHALGGLHVVVREGDGIDGVVAHGSLVPRRMLVSGRPVRCGYVEAVAVHPDRQRRGLGARVMAELEALAPGYDLLALSSSAAGLPFYRARGWVPWRGPTAVLAPTGIELTPEEDGSVFVLHHGDLDLRARIACDWRVGDVW